jgi:hypothetical protein
LARSALNASTLLPIFCSVPFFSSAMIMFAPSAAAANHT